MSDRRNVDKPTADSLFETHWSYVVSICRRQLRDRHEAEDAAQETFMKLLRREGPWPDNVRAWLATAARTTSIDHIRRQAKQRERRERWETQGHRQAREAAGATALQQHVVQTKLPEAMAALGAADATLLAERYVQDLPLRVMAARRSVSVPTMSRRVGGAVKRLSDVLEDMGVVGAGRLSLPAYLASLGGEVVGDYGIDQGLRLSPQWPGRQTLGPGRVMRVGVMASYENAFKPSNIGLLSFMEGQLTPVSWITDPSVEMVGVIDPGSQDRGPIEVALRDYELNAGLIDLTDHASLSTLDVLILGSNHLLSTRAIRSILHAVRSGMGLYQTGHAGSTEPGERDPALRELLLAESPLWSYCSGLVGRYRFHCTPCSGTVVSEHPAMPWLRVGDTVTLTTCGAIFKPRPEATVIAVRDDKRRPNGHGGGGHHEQAFQSPAVLAGHIGRGRVVSLHFNVNQVFYGWDERLARRFGQVLDWLTDYRFCAGPKNRSDRNAIQLSGVSGPGEDSA